METRLIKEAKKNKPQAQTALYEKYKRYWFSICLRYQSNKSDAEDCMQNSLVKIFTQIASFDINKGEFKSWTSKIVVNENLLFLRSIRRTEELAEENTRDYAYNDYPEEESAVSAEKLVEMIQHLPDGYRTVFNLYVLEGYTHQEIAQILDITTGTSKSQLSKARLMLRKHMEVLL